MIDYPLNLFQTSPAMIDFTPNFSQTSSMSELLQQQDFYNNQTPSKFLWWSTAFRISVELLLQVVYSKLLPHAVYSELLLQVVYSELLSEAVYSELQLQAIYSGLLL